MSRKQFVEGIEDLIKKFDVIASGTITVQSGVQYPMSPVVNQITKLYRNYILLLSNKTGVNITSVTIYGVITIDNIPLPNTIAGSTVYLKDSAPISNQSDGHIMCVDLTSEEPNVFVAGDMRFQPKLSAGPAAACTIDYALIGY